MAKTISDYSEEITNTSKSVLLELAVLLKRYSDALVLVGGWVPYFLLEKYQKNKEFKHIGSIDIDFAVNPKLIDIETYKTIVELLKSRGYKPKYSKLGEKIPYIFIRDVNDTSIKVDFLSLAYVDKPKKRHRKVQIDLPARTMKGCEIVFENHYFKHKISGNLPGNGEIKTEINVSDVVGCITTKGFVLDDRIHEKDAYDIYSVVAYYKNGPEDCAKEIKPFTKNGLVAEALDLIKERFESVRSAGPIWVQSFEPKITAREAFEKLSKFFELLET